MSEVEKELATIKANVEYLLRVYPEARNDDKYLMILYWRLIDKANIPFIPWSTIRDFTSPVSIWRMRQKLQSEGSYPSTDPSVLARRQARALAFREVIPNI